MHEEVLSNILNIISCYNEGKVVGRQVIGKNQWKVCKKYMLLLRAHTINSSVVKTAATRRDPSATAQPWERKSLKFYVK